MMFGSDGAPGVISLLFVRGFASLFFAENGCWEWMRCRMLCLPVSVLQRRSGFSVALEGDGEGCQQGTHEEVVIPVSCHGARSCVRVSI